MTPPFEGSATPFAELTELAAQLCATPIAAVILCSAEDQRYEASFGPPLASSARAELLRVCTSEPVLVPDLTVGERATRVALTAGDQQLAFLAVVPLVGGDGAQLGVLCVLDLQPRTLTELQLAQISVLGRQLVSQYELRHRAQQDATAESTLRENRDLLDAVLEHADALVFVKDLAGRFLLASRELHRALDLPEGALLGRTDHEMFPPVVADDFLRNDRAIAALGERQVFVEQLRHGDGTLHSYQSTKFPLRDATGQIYGVAGVSTDITELSAERAAHGDAEQRWRKLVEHSSAAIAVLGQDARFAYVNPQAVRLYGAGSAADLLGRSVFDLVPDDASSWATSLFEAQLGRSGLDNQRRWVLRRLDGKLATIEVNSTTIVFDGAPAVQVELHDVTARVDTEERLAESERRFRTLFEHAPAGTAELLPDGTVVAANSELCRMLGYTVEEIIGLHASVAVANQDEGERQSRGLSTLELTGSYFDERMYRRKDGTQLPVLVGVAAVSGSAGGVERVLVTVVDISERVAAAAALKRAHLELADRQIFSDAVLESIDVGVVACDVDGTVTVSNSAARAWYGLEQTTEAPLVRNAAAGILGNVTTSAGEPLADEQTPLLRSLREGSVNDMEIILEPAGMPAVHLLCAGRALSAPDGRPLGAVLAMTDITQAREHTLELKASERRFRTIFDNDPAGLAVVSTKGKILQVNPALLQIVGLTEGELMQHASLAELAPEASRAGVKEVFLRALKDPGTTVTSEQRLTHPDGHELWMVLTLTHLPDPSEGSCMMLQLEDITDRKLAEQRLTRQALYDNLTSLPNRALLLDRTTSALNRLSARPEEGMVVMLFCDLDGFKAVNDTYGHEAGDQLLVEIARRLIEVVRRTDTVARLGGDEFVVLCENLSGDEELANVVQRIEEAIATPVDHRGHELVVTASVGIAHASGALTAQELVRHADAAMYQAKRLGKNRNEVFDEDMRARSSNRARAESDLRTALRTDGVEVHYQPIFDLPARRIVALEALARLRLPDGTMAMPDSFIPVAEETGLIVTLGTGVLRSACQQLASWRAELGRDIRVAVNLSARQAARADLCEVVRDALDDAGLPAEALSLELTESVLLDAASATLERLSQLRASGVDIGIDDFGTGYASLRYLRDLPINFIKVDRSFVAGMSEHHQDAVIVGTVIALARDLGLGCVVEGVETQDQLERISATGARAQGYLLGRPTPAAQTGVLLAAER